MKQLISVITQKISNQVKRNEINMVRLESFDDPIIYRSICETFRHSNYIDHFIPKLTLEKYRQFEKAFKENWTQALIYLHKGENPVQETAFDGAYANASYIDFNQAITKWRNESPNMPKGKTSLILLMGTEAAPDDAGSLQDTTFLISPREIIKWLSNDYGEWFVDILKKNSLDNKENRKAIHTLYRTIFSSVNVNIFKLSSFIDSLQTMSFDSCQELINYICETLNVIWEIPSIIDNKAIPKVQKLKQGRLSDAKIISNAIRFIDRSEDIPSASSVKKLKEKFQKYAEKNEIDVDDPFPTDTTQFPDYQSFENCVIDFMCGIDLEKNRAILLNFDYAIIEAIIGTKLDKKPQKKAPTITGIPMEAYAKIFLDIANEFYHEYSSFPTNYSIRIEQISLPDCIDDKKEEAYLNLCNFMGGILTFFNSAGITCDDEEINFEYENAEDPFDFNNYLSFSDRVKGTGKWGDPCKIQIKVKAANEDNSHNYEYKWIFSPYIHWMNAFSFLSTTLFNDSTSYVFPTMVTCKNIQDYLRCESEDEFYSQINQIDAQVLYHEHMKEVQHYFSSNGVFGIFSALCDAFKNFTLKLTGNGFYAALNELRIVVSIYTTMMDNIRKNYGAFTDVQKEKIALLVNSFVISSNANVIENCNMAEVLLPAYHPVMLEKIDAQQIFLRDGFAEIFMSYMDQNLSMENVKAKLENLIQLASITQGVDTIVKKSSTYMTCSSMWEYYGVYYDADSVGDLISGNALGGAIITDDEDATAMLRITPMSHVVVRNIMDYVRTFPARIDGLNVSFVAPTDMQHIVAAIHLIAKEFENTDTFATINLNIICINSKKNSSSYLKRWLDSYFDDARNVKVNTFLRNITIGSEPSEADCLEKLLKNCDLCFNYNILESADVLYDKTGKEIIDKEQAKFPMTFTPDTIAATHGKSRKIGISQFQFLAAKKHTQANFVICNPNSVEGTYRTFKTLELTDVQNRIIEISHDACKWVVCVDPAIDRRMLDNTNSRIIGFTTGEGCYGELNVTVSARKDILSDIKSMLTSRIKEKFSNWDDVRLQKAATFCIDEMSKHMDGSRVLKALNPYDYEIHSFLAYILTLQMLGLSQKDDNYAIRALISLDSYKHWFAEDDELSKDNKRPDFMLIEIPISEENLDPDMDLNIQIKIIECKMGFQNDAHIEKAQTQLEKGIRTMSANWNPNNTSIMHRYWLNQLYRAIIFSPLNLNNTSSEYNVIRNKIYGILSGHYQIEWTGDVFAFWLDSDDEIPNEYVLDSTLPDELYDEDIPLENLVCHCCGQVFIQKMLVPPEERSATFVHNNIVNQEEQLESDDENEYSSGEVLIAVEPDIDISQVFDDNEGSLRDVQTNDLATNTESVADSEITTEEKTKEEAHDSGDEFVIPEETIDVQQESKQSLSSVRLLLGEDLKTKEKFYWEFGNKELNNRHLLINGNSGCGKTYCIQALLMEASRQNVSSVIFDYTGGFAPSKLDKVFKETLGDKIVQRFVRKDKIPVNPFKKQIIQMDEDFSYPEEDADVARKVADVFKSVYKTFGDQQFACMYDAILSGLKTHGDEMNFDVMVSELEKQDSARAHSVLSKLRPFTDLKCFVKDETFSWETIQTANGEVFIFQLASYDRDTQILLTEFLLWDIWNYCTQFGDETKPIILVMDEAQNLSHQENSPSGKILTEGRKFGISGWYATQFMKPQLDDAEIQRLQQAGQKLYFCPPDEGVVTVSKNIDISSNGSKEWAERLKKLKKGECVTCGNMVKNEKWTKYEPRIIKVTSLQTRLSND